MCCLGLYRFGLVPDRAPVRTGLVPTGFSSLSIPPSPPLCSFSVFFSSLFSSRFSSLLPFFSFVSCSNGFLFWDSGDDSTERRKTSSFLLFLFFLLGLAWPYGPI